MKTFVILFALFCAIVAEEKKKDCPVEAALKKTVEGCIELLSPSEETLELVALRKGMDKPEVKCFYACMWNKSTLMENAKFKLDTLEELLRAGNEPEEKIKILLDAAKECKEKAEVSADECEVAAKITECNSALNSLEEEK